MDIFSFFKNRIKRKDKLIQEEKFEEEILIKEKTQKKEDEKKKELLRIKTQEYLLKQKEEEEILRKIEIANQQKKLKEEQIKKEKIEEERIEKDRIKQEQIKNKRLEKEKDFKNKLFQSKNELDFNSFDSIKIGLASPEKIRQWSKGEVKKPETINYRTLKPEEEGLFCEKIFGPTKDWECHCGKYKRVRYKGVICDRCGVEVTKSKVRRERMGHIELAAPVSHIWYFKGIPSRMGLILDMSPRALEKVLYFASYIVIDGGDTPLYEKQLLNEGEYRNYLEEYPNKFKAMMGAEAIKTILSNIDLEKESLELRRELKDAMDQKKLRITRKLEVIEAFRNSGNKPEWMILDVLPVIPPDLRPMVQLDGGRFATSDLNDLYRRVINRNNRLKRLLDLGAPEIIVRNEKRKLQEVVDALIDNGRRGRPVTGPGNRPLKSLSDMLKGKQGRFRQNLLGKRVDYSGRSVIVVGPELKLFQCGLPKQMALELFKPFVIKKLVEEDYAHSIESAKRMVERVKPQVWDVLDIVIKDHPVMLNKQLTLHKLGIQAFEPILVDGKAIKLHPLVCKGYNADFDGDEISVHLPLSTEAQVECRLLMLSTNNLLFPRDGKPVVTPAQDMVLGIYYLTMHKTGEVGEGKLFKDYDEMIVAYYNKFVGIHSKVKVRIKLNQEDRGKLVESTVGRFIFNEKIPQSLGFVDRKIDPYSLEVNSVVDKKLLSDIIDKCFRNHGNNITSVLLDDIKEIGFHYSTISGLSISLTDIVVPDEKKALIETAEREVDKFERSYRRGLITDDERYESVIKIWNKTTEDVTDVFMDSLDPLNSMYIMAVSGARGSKNQIRQLGGIRGLMSSASGRTIEMPIKSNFREGLDVLEFFISTSGSRDCLVDRSIRTADAGYLTRRFIDVSQHCVVREVDCGTEEYLLVKALREGNEIIEELKDRIEGRYAFEDIVDPDTGKILVKENEMISEINSELIQSLGVKEVKIRSILACKTRFGVCAHCYGRDLSTGNKVSIGEAVGIIAAQSIGEVGTQLTMRTFHTGGVAAVADITQSLPRVKELFEARKPKGLAIISEIAGTVSIIDTKKKKEATITSPDGETATYTIIYGSRMRVKDGDVIEAGEELTDGFVNPHDILQIIGIQGVQNYLIKEVQRVYRLHGVDISDKHIEIIVKQMLCKLKIEEAGDTDMIPGSLVNVIEFEQENNEILEEGLEAATGRRTLLGITKASLATDSFLSAASFQETTRVLTEAAIKGKEDHLLGLKENVILGKLIPAGTGMKRYRDVEVVKDEYV